LSELRFPLIIVNFKAYPEVEGEGALSLARACADVAAASGVSIVACPPMVELGRVASSVRIPVMAQHVDHRSPGSATGWVTAEMVRHTGAIGTLLNHSEHRLSLDNIRDVASASKKAGLRTCICAESANSSGEVALFEPDMVAVEPPELIGGEVSVTNAKPEVVVEAVQAVHQVDASIPVLCGAGIKNGQDVKKAIELGAKGVLLASGVVKAKDQRQALRDLIRFI
jgi:triosephosphate isomerase (TIM)